MDDVETLCRKLDRLEAMALLHGRTEAIEREIADLVARPDDLEQGAGEDWLRGRDRDLGRALGP